MSWQLQPRKGGRGPEGAEFIPLSAGYLSGDLQRMKTKGPERGPAQKGLVDPTSRYPAWLPAGFCAMPAFFL